MTRRSCQVLGLTGSVFRRRRRLRRLLIRMANLKLANTRLPHGCDEIDIAMMARAIDLAGRAAAADEVPVGAVLYRGREIIAEAYNNREKSKNPAGHAEMLALIAAGSKLGTWRMNECTLAVTLEPCPMCAGALVNARLGRLIYGASDPKAGACHTLYNITSDKRLNHTVKVVQGVLGDQCSRLLTDFFKRRRAENQRRKTG